MWTVRGTILTIVLFLLLASNISHSFRYTAGCDHLGAKFGVDTTIKRWCSKQESFFRGRNVERAKMPSFSRVVHVSKVPLTAPARCQLLAEETELVALASRYNIPNLNLFAANVTLFRKDTASIVVSGTIRAQFADDLTGMLNSQFHTLLLHNRQAGGSLPFVDATDYDDEIAQNGEIDVGEIAAQYLALELS